MKPERNLVLVLAEADPAGHRRALHDLRDGIDAVELRIDLLSPEHRTSDVVADLVRSSPVPVVVTCRTCAEGGGFDGGDAELRDLLAAGLGAGAALIDVEWRRLREAPGLTSGWSAARILLSHHAPGGTTHALEDTLFDMLHVPSAGVKLVSEAASFSEAVRLVDMTRSVVRGGRRAACFSNGAAARASRLLSFVEGAWLTFLAPDDAVIPHAPLLTVSEALDIYRLDALSESVKLLGLFGHPLGHSLSPRMQNGVIRVLGERYLYVPLDGDSVADLVEFARRHDLRGASVTRPHKETIVPFLDRLDETARAAGAVNTLVREGAEFVGWNTDLMAARTVLREWAAGPADRAVVLGAGGAARAVLAALRERGVPTRLLNRGRDRGERLAAETGATWAGAPPRLAAESATILVNATPLGAGGESIEFPEWMTAGVRVLDLAYRPEGTPLELEARRRGLLTYDGLEFLALQGAAQFALWTRRLVNPDLFREALRGPATTRESLC
jgi:shikimate dehydrogenase/3-dehydroquinate dehydratase type I